MLLTKKLKRALYLLPIALLAHSAWAEESASSVLPSTSITSFDFSKVSKNLKANYLGWLAGAHSKALNGDVSKTGFNQLALYHYAAVGAKLNSNMSLMITAPFTQTFGAQSSAKPAKQFTANDPYISLSHKSLLKNEKLGMNLSGMVRYYTPLSKATVNSTASRTDARNGSVRAVLDPTKTFLDDKLTLSGKSLIQYRFARAGAGERIAKTGKDIHEDYFYILNPSIAYDFSQKFGIAIEYATGYMRHTTDGHFTNTRDSTYGQSISPSVTWTPNKKLMINPYVAWGESGVSPTKAFAMSSYNNTGSTAFYKNMDIGMQVQYTFL